MQTKFILAFFRVSVTVLFYLMLLLTLVVLLTGGLTIFSNGKKSWTGSFDHYDYEFMGYHAKKEQTPFTYSSDSLIRYQEARNRYQVQVEPRSGIGYYTLGIKVLLMSLGLAILWHFMKIFKDTRLDHPFRHGITRRLRMLAALFIIADCIKFIHYFVLNKLVKQSVASPDFELSAEVGDGLITGMILLIIAVIFQRGIELQEENALTV